MSKNQIKIRLIKLALGEKIVGVGALLLVLGAFLPWYKDIDKFKIGDMFLGITGPLYLAGFIVLAAGALSLFVISFKVLGKKLPNLPVKEGQLHFVTSSLSFFMLVMAASVYFHHKFGINITAKSAGVGMVMAFVGSVVLFLGAIVARGKKKSDDIFEEDGYLEPLIDINEPRERHELEPESDPAKIPTIEEMMAAVDTVTVDSSSSEGDSTGAFSDVDIDID